MKICADDIMCDDKDYTFKDLSGKFPVVNDHEIEAESLLNKLANISAQSKDFAVIPFVIYGSVRTRNTGFMIVPKTDRIEVDCD